MNRGQLLPAGVWVGIGSAIAASACNLGLGVLSSPGPGLFPFGIGVGIALLALSVVATGLRAPATASAAAETRRSLPVIAVVAALFFYAMALERIGFVPCTMLFLAGLLGVLGRPRWPVVVMASAGITLAAYLIFVKVLKINLPAGPLGF
jgi:putative tricarboxylic transport membrane protein